MPTEPVPDADGPSADRELVAAVRRFNRFYTRRVGALDEGHLRSPFSLAEVRVLYEIAHREAPAASGIGRDLRLDAGYLSRLLSGLAERGLVERVASPSDARKVRLRLTRMGRSTFARLDARAHDDVARMLAPLTVAERRRVRDALRTAHRLLAERASGAVEADWTLRTHEAGDLGWIVQRHGAIYAREYGWDQRFEGLVAGIIADFARDFDPARERCWIAERDGENVGSVVLVRHPERAGVARLRLLLVEPSARGLGIGQRLVAECVAFARASGYHTLTLWTNSVLIAARRLYEAAGFTLLHEAPHRSFGHELVEQTWELAL